MTTWYQKSIAVALVYVMLTAIARCQSCPAGCSCDSTRNEVMCSGITKLPTNLPSNTKTLVVNDCNLGGAIGGALDASHMTYLRSSTVEHLTIENCNVTEIRPMAFYIYAGLKSLSLAKNKLKVIELVSLVGLSGLQSLNLKDNEISSLKIGAFVSMDQLTYLDISGNKLKSFPNELFIPLVSLKALDLSDNEFKTFPASVFKGLDAITKLNASSNKLTNIPDNAFQGLPNIQTLDLSNNNLTSFPRSLFEKLTYLRTLILDSNRMQLNSPGLMTLYGLKAITHLSLKSNNLNDVDLSAFHGMTNLANLDLSKNNLTAVRSGIFTGVANLQKLMLNDNPINKIERNAFKDLTGLQYLHLAKTSLKTLDGAVFNPLTNLIKLFLECNAFTAIPSNMNLPKLQYLHLENNKLTSYGNSFSYLKALRYLYLNNNQLQSFPNLSLSNFYHIEIRNNFISSLSSRHFSSISNLRFLFLDNNKIQTLYENQVKSYFATMTRISFGGNPFHCNCEVAWMKDISGLKAYADDVKALRCKTPHTKLLITETTDSNLVCTLPKFVYSSTFVVTENNDLIFNCTAEADPAPNVYWENVNVGTLSNAVQSCGSCQTYSQCQYHWSHCWGGRSGYACKCSYGSPTTYTRIISTSSYLSQDAPLDKTTLKNSHSFRVSNAASQSFNYQCKISNVKGTQKITFVKENN